MVWKFGMIAAYNIKCWVDQEMPESNLHGHCVVNPQMFPQEEFQELHFVPDRVLGDDGMYTLTGMLMRWFGYFKSQAKKKIDLCVYCNPTNPL